MLKNKFQACGFIVIVVLSFGLISPKEISAETGKCTCSVNAGRMLYVVTDNCNPTTEYAKCGGGQSGPATCDCIEKENSELPINTCECTGSGVITASSCQGDTPRENCVTRSSPVYCYCSQETSNRTDDDIAPRPGTPEAAELEISTNNYDPFGDCGENYIDTALGCIPYDTKEFTSWLLVLLFGISGGIAFLLMVYGFIMMAMSSGDEKKMQGAKETVTSAITGLLVVIFALFLYRLIAVNILQIPGIN